MESVDVMQKSAAPVWKWIVRCFLAGLLAILPLAVTGAVVIWCAALVRQFIGPDTAFGRVLRRLGIHLVGPNAETAAYAVGWLIVVLTILALGAVLELGIKKVFNQLLERMMQRIPLVSSIYSTSKQMIDMLGTESPAGDTKAMMSPVLCSFGDGATPAVLALLASPDRYVVQDREYRMILIPTAPVPFGGALLMMPSEHVHALDMSVDGLVSIYASMGITGPRFLPVRRAEPKVPREHLA